jgi:hypothetical protein
LVKAELNYDSKSEDYHDDMKNKNYKQYFEEEFISRVPLGSRALTECTIPQYTR